MSDTEAEARVALGIALAARLSVEQFEAIEPVLDAYRDVIIAAQEAKYGDPIAMRDASYTDGFKAGQEILEAKYAALEATVRLADELCVAVENAELDIGGSRPVGVILRELGPATDAALAAIKEPPWIIQHLPAEHECYVEPASGG